MATRQRLRGDGQRAIDAITAAVRSDDVAAAALRRRADDRPAHERILGAPMDRHRGGRAFVRVVRREPDVPRGRRRIDAHRTTPRNAQYTRLVVRPAASAMPVRTAFGRASTGTRAGVPASPFERDATGSEVAAARGMR